MLQGERAVVAVVSMVRMVLVRGGEAGVGLVGVVCVGGVGIGGGAGCVWAEGRVCPEVLSTYSVRLVLSVVGAVYLRLWVVNMGEKTWRKLRCGRYG
jgi:hypothetical protein